MKKQKTPCPLCGVNVVINRYNATIHSHCTTKRDEHGRDIWCAIYGIKVPEAEFSIDAGEIVSDWPRKEK